MKFTKLTLAALMATSLVACSSKPESSKPASTPAASASSSAEEEVVTEGKYTVTNVSGEKVTALYFYQTGSEDKGENYAEGGLDDQASVVVEISVDEDKAEGYAQTVEFTTESGETVVAFDNLHLEEAPMFLKPTADVTGGATPFLNNAE